MPRARLLKPGFFTNEALGELSPLHRICYEGLWTIADREGRLEDRPKRIKLQVLPFDDVDIDQILTDLAQHNFIRRYVANGDYYIAIPTFLKHQNPHVNESKSAIPAPPKTANKQHRASTVQTPDENSASTVQIPEDSGDDRPPSSTRVAPEDSGLVLDPRSGVLDPESRSRVLIGATRATDPESGSRATRAAPSAPLRGASPPQGASRPKGVSEKTKRNLANMERLLARRKGVSRER
jgi:hypothetical protein